MVEEKKKSSSSEALSDAPKSEIKGAITSKPADVDALERAPAATPNASSIISAEPIRRSMMAVYLGAGLIASIVIAVVFCVLYISRASEIATLERDLKDEQEYVQELKERLNAAGY